MEHDHTPGDLLVGAICGYNAVRWVGRAAVPLGWPDHLAARLAAAAIALVPMVLLHRALARRRGRWVASGTWGALAALGLFLDHTLQDGRLDDLVTLSPWRLAGALAALVGFGAALGCVLQWAGDRTWGERGAA